jgi:hypothetical protein
MSGVIPKLLALAIPASVLALSGAAGAQAVHYDLGASVGVSQHVQTDIEDGNANPGPGVVGEIQGHIAAAPMLRVGLYALYDYSPRSGEPARNFFGGGLSLRILPPIFRTRCTFWWIGLGLGYEEVTAAGFNTTVTNSSTNAAENVSFPATTGGELEIPLSIGVARRIKKPLVLFAEIGTRFGVASFGDYYAGRPGVDTSSNTDLLAFAPGNDTFAFFLSGGIMIDR